MLSPDQDDSHPGRLVVCHLSQHMEPRFSCHLLPIAGFKLQVLTPNTAGYRSRPAQLGASGPRLSLQHNTGSFSVLEKQNAIKAALQNCRVGLFLCQVEAAQLFQLIDQHFRSSPLTHNQLYH